MRRLSGTLALFTLLTSACRAPEGSRDEERGTLIVLNKSDATASWIEASSRKPLTQSSTGTGPHEVACRGSLAVVADYGEQTPGNTLTVLDARTGETVRTISLGEHRRPHGIVWIDDRHVLVTTEQSQALLRVDVNAGEVVATYKTDQRVSHMVAVTPDARRAFVANIGSNTVSVIDLDAGQLSRNIEVGNGPEGIDVSPDGTQVWVGNRSGDTVSVIDANSLDVLETLPCAKFPIRLKFTPDGKHVLVSCAESGDVAVFDALTRKEERRVAMNLTASETSKESMFGDQFGTSPVPIGILVRPDGKRAWVANTNANMVTEIDLESWEVVARIPTGRQPDGLGWSAK